MSLPSSNNHPFIYSHQQILKNPFPTTIEKDKTIIRQNSPIKIIPVDSILPKKKPSFYASPRYYDAPHPSLLPLPPVDFLE